MSFTTIQRKKVERQDRQQRRQGRREDNEAFLLALSIGLIDDLRIREGTIATLTPPLIRDMVVIPYNGGMPPGPNNSYEVVNRRQIDRTQKKGSTPTPKGVKMDPNSNQQKTVLEEA